VHLVGFNYKVFHFIFQSSHALVIGRFRLNGKSRKTFNIIMCTQSVFLNLGNALQPGSPSSLGCFPDLPMDSLRTFSQTELLCISSDAYALCS
jgi:hypothetical protein